MSLSLLVVVVDSLVREIEISVARARLQRRDANARRRTAVDESVLNDCAEKRLFSRLAKPARRVSLLPPYLPPFLSCARAKSPVDRNFGHTPSLAFFYT